MEYTKRAMGKFKNTIQKGEIRYIVFREKGVWYGVGLECNIVEEGEDPREVLLRLFEATNGYLKSAKKIKARPHILNQKVDPEYEALWEKLEERKSSVKNLGIPYDIYTYGRKRVLA